MIGGQLDTVSWNRIKLMMATAPRILMKPFRLSARIIFEEKL